MKYKRHAKIIELIDSEQIETQEELSESLKLLGFNVTQATVSRDIKELRLIKVTSNTGKNIYARLNQSEGTASDKLMIIFSEAFISCDYSLNTIVVKTLSGMAGAVAESIDSLKIFDILGSIAGDNTIFIICKSEESAKNLVAKFNNLAQSEYKKRG